jgi:hypothetical protein
VVRHGKVRRAKLYYIRRLSAREARLKERREKMAEKTAALEATGADGEIEEPVAEQEAAEEEVEEVKEAE